MPKLPPFELLAAQSGTDNEPLLILALDPGETVGWCLWQGTEVIDSGQVRTTEYTYRQIKELQDLFTTLKPDVVVYESYRIYSWMADTHQWSEVHTAQIIGIIRFLCVELGIPYTMQTAQVAKQFMTDEKMKTWGLWKKGQRHARDSIRHASWFRLFGSLEKTWTRNGAPKK